MHVEMEALYKKLGYSFADSSLITQALTHSSYANEKGRRECRSYERLEFLGDAVLQLIISDHLYSKYRELPEGELTKLRSRIVCEATLADCAKQLRLGEYMLFGRGEALTGGRTRASILADCFESVVAAIYRDSDMDNAREFVLRNLDNKISDAVMGRVFVDYKTRLQEVVQAHKISNIRYVVAGSSGPDHNKTFAIDVVINGLTAGIGSGRSKKEAEQLAAKMALENIDVIIKSR